MNEDNPFKIKKLGSKVKNFNAQKWKNISKQTAFNGVYAKFSQSNMLKTLLLSTGNCKIAESSEDPFWGTGVHLRDKLALNENNWKSTGGGAMCEILGKVRHELH